MPSNNSKLSSSKRLHSVVEVGEENENFKQKTRDCQESGKVVPLKRNTRSPKLLVLNGVARNNRRSGVASNAKVEKVPSVKKLKKQTSNHIVNDTQEEHQKPVKNRGRNCRVASKHPALEEKQHGVIRTGEYLPQIIEEPTPPPINLEMLRNQERDEEDSFNCKEYACDIIKYWLALERRWQLAVDYHSLSPDVTPRARSTLVGWLVQVAGHLSLHPETLEICVSLVDRYVACKQVKIGYYQLLGVTSLFVACKYEERFIPEVSDFLYLTENVYNYDQMMKQEAAILTRLKFQVFTPIPSIYISTLLKKAEELMAGTRISFKKVEHLARYILALSLTESHFSVIPASVRASSAVSLALELIRRSEDHTSQPDSFKLVTIEERITVSVKKCISSMICTLIHSHKESSHQDLKKQFSSASNSFIGLLAILSDCELLRNLLIGKIF